MSDWRNGLFGCFNNCTVCICAYFLPCYVAGKVAEKVGDSCLICGLVSFVPFVGCYARVTTRGKVRAQKGIPGGTVDDCMVVWCCSLCTLVQEAQEVDALSMAQSISRE